jgi:hypothetical protein
MKPTNPFNRRYGKWENDDDNLTFTGGVVLRDRIAAHGEQRKILTKFVKLKWVEYRTGAK